MKFQHSKATTSAALFSLICSSVASPIWWPSLDFKGLQTVLTSSSEDDNIVSSDGLLDYVNKSGLLARAHELYALAVRSEPSYGHPTRVIGSPGHEKTIEYIKSELSKLGDYYNVSTQDFEAYSGFVYESRLVINGEIPKSAEPLSLTGPTKDKEPVYGRIVHVPNGGCSVSDFDSVLASDSIALIERGTCSFGVKSENAGAAGAFAAVIFDNQPGDTLHGTLGEVLPHQVATFGINREDGQKYVKLIEEGKALEGSAYIDGYINVITTQNIIAETRGGNADSIVCLGAHSDSVAEGPGINDDGTGTISLLEVASGLANYNVTNKVRFAWWSAEEEGLVGSNYYVSQLSPEENRKIRVFMDYDMMASPNYAYQIYDSDNSANPNGSSELRQLYIDFYESQGVNYTFIPFDGRSDYYAFIENGIPGGGVATGAEGIKTEEEVELFGGKAGEWYDSCYHQLCDDTTNLNYDAWLINTRLIAHSVATYGASLKGFPEREVEEKVSSYRSKFKYRGSKLIF
ncbi:Zn-dependent exopeptidase [Nadsonia fulvescens var. elongata DSM 6958]|uniref:Peptide hydrolase n=1 Tax=Nadsonia fulvescens var. elongata DSM 6958 TaxID=857566 RepID=A0A1E3PR37_9ASCO|nr:Zn-dependent exopeptidase [Nadsonia fulvescens var. elongata DSM 6958]